VPRPRFSRIWRLVSELSRPAPRLELPVRSPKPSPDRMSEPVSVEELAVAVDAESVDVAVAVRDRDRLSVAVAVGDTVADADALSDTLTDPAAPKPVLKNPI